MTTILHNNSWLGDNGLDLFELIFIFIILLWWYMFLTKCDYSKGELPYGHRKSSVVKSAMSSLTGGSHV
jgi:hypothetical protein